jgi:hypothetical protein
MILETVDRRVLGAIEFVDAPTGARIHAPLVVEAPGVRFLRNPSALYVVMSAQGLVPITNQWLAQPAVPSLGSTVLVLQITDPTGQYLRRRAQMSLPRDASVANAAQPTSLFSPAVVQLYPAPAARTAPGWALVRASVTSSGPGTPPIEGGLVRIVRSSDGVRLASGVSDEHGEALVAVAGLPLFNVDGGNGPVLTSQIAVTVQAVTDPAAQLPIDPDDLERRQAVLPGTSSAANLTAGRVVAVSLSV